MPLMNVSRNSAKSRQLPLAVKQLLKNQVLGPDYDLSVAWVTPDVIHRHNLNYRGKDKPTNILSFPLSDKAGEILLCADLMSEAEVIPLFIHGLLHLKGRRHGSRMEQEERQIANFFFSNAPKYRRRT